MTIDIEAIRAAEIRAGLDWNLENAHPLLMAVGPLTDEIDRLKRGYGQELMDAEAELAQALGYTYDDEYGWVTGDHTVVTLAMEARRRIEDLSAQIDRLKAVAP